MNLNNKIKYRINYQIRVPNVRVNLGQEQLGIMPTDKARNIAVSEGMDLIEIIPNANPPVCLIADFGKLKYEMKIKEKESAKKRRESVQAIKEIRLTPTIAKHDIDVKSKAIERFLEEGKKVQIMMKFSRRELHHKDIGIQTINSILEMFTEKATVEFAPRFEGNRLNCRLAPKDK